MSNNFLWPVRQPSDVASTIHEVRSMLHSCICKCTVSWENLLFAICKKGATVTCFHYIDSAVSLLSNCQNSSLFISSLAVQLGLCPTCSATPRTGFLMKRVKLAGPLQKGLKAHHHSIVVFTWIYVSVMMLWWIYELNEYYLFHILEIAVKAVLVPSGGLLLTGLGGDLF